MRFLAYALLVIAAARLSAASLPPVAPILTREEIASAANDVPVGRIDFVMPEGDRAAEEALAKRFFNQPAERRYAGVTTDDWSAKWDLFSDALIRNATSAGLESESLAKCLRALDRGRNRQTMLWPAKDQKFFPPGTSNDEVEKFEAEAEKKYQEVLRERDAHPEKYYNQHLAALPVGAYVARHAKGECWIIVCKWEYLMKDEALPLGHIMIWAMDTRTTDVVAYVTCD